MGGMDAALDASWLGQGPTYRAHTAIRPNAPSG
jgi:hypothetical protein